MTKSFGLDIALKLSSIKKHVDAKMAAIKKFSYIIYT